MGEPRRRCSNCGESYAEGVIFCPRDGSALSLRARDGGPDPYLGQTIGGTFRVEALIGTGAVGRVYRAHQLGVERSVALKIMHRDLCANETLCSRFRREARVAGSLTHPNLVSVLSLGDLDSDGLRVPYLALEYLDGLSLRSAFLAQGAMPQARALHIMLQIADAVGVAHEHGIVHRDLKPENVMLVRRGDDADFVKVLDFGVARVDHGDPSVATHAGAIFGSARYVSPESAAGGEASAASDVYALATIYYECLSGKTPFDGDSPIQILLKHQSAPVPALPATGAEPVPPELAHFIARNLAKDPAARASDARVFARELVAAAHSAGVDAELGLSSRTRRGHAVAPTQRLTAEIARQPESRPLRRDLPSSAAGPTSKPVFASRPAGATRRALFVLLCFALGAGAALGIATKLGAFGDKSGAPAPSRGTAP
jgi:eukaryotic-like serine/threonine-protein kinase